MNKTAEHVFSQLDLKLRLVLASISQEQEHTTRTTQTWKDWDNSNQNKQKEDTNEDAVILQILRTQSSLLVQLRQTIQSLVTPSLSEKKDQVETLDIPQDGCVESRRNLTRNQDEHVKLVHTRQALLDMAEYIILPLVLILQSRSNDIGYKNGKNKDISNVRESAKLNCLMESAQTLTVYVQIVHCNGIFTQDLESIAIQNDGETIDGSGSSNSGTSGGQCMVIKTKTRMKCVIACAMALASIDRDTLAVAAGSEQQNTSDDKSKGPSHHSTGIHPLLLKDQEDRKCSKLDKGEESFHSILECIEFLVLQKSHSSGKLNSTVVLSSAATKNEEEEFSVQMVRAMDGCLIARVVQSCLFCFDNPFPTSTLKTEQLVSRIEGRAGTKKNPQQDLRGNIPLKLQALHTLQSIFNIESISGNNIATEDGKDGSDELVGIFRSLLPGCFAGLYKQSLDQLRFSTSMSSPKIAVASIRVLVILLNRTLSGMGQTESEKRTSPSQNAESSFATLLAASSSLASTPVKTTVNVQTPIKHKGLSPDLVAFLNQVNSKIAPLLKVLFSLIPSHRSVKVKRIGVEFLCRSILVDTCLVWERSNSANIEDEEENNTQSTSDIVGGAMDCLLTLLGDTEACISKACRDVIVARQLKIGVSRWREEMSEKIIPKTLDTIESLPVLARSGREIELQTQLKLICGYLTLSYDEKFLERKEANFLGERILNGSMKDIFTIDTKSTIISLQVLPDRLDDLDLVDSCNFSYLKKENTTIAKRMVFFVGRMLSHKQVVLFIDSCIAQLFDDLSEKTCKRWSLCDRRHGDWLDKRIGLIVIASEVLKSQSSTLKKRSKLISSLSESILPIIFSDPLWQLPTTLEWARITWKTRSGGDALNYYFRSQTSHRLPTASVSINSDNKTTNSFVKPEISTSALNANSIFITYLMEIVGAASNILQSTFDRFLPTVLYPLLQKTSAIHSDFVRQAASMVLSRISIYLQYQSIEDLLSSNYGYLMETLASEFGSPHQIEGDNQGYQQALCFYSVYNVIDMAMKNLYCRSINNNKVGKINDGTRIILLVELLNSMILWFDKRFDKGRKTIHQHMIIPVSLIKVFASSTQYINLLLTPEREEIESKSSNFSAVINDDEPWMDLLSQFEMKNVNIEHENYISGEEGFLFHHRNQEESEEEEIITSKSSDKEVDKINGTQFYRTPESLKLVTKTTRRMLSSSCFFLSTSDLKLQRVSCDMLINGFILLSTLQSIAKQLDDNCEVGNPLLEAVHHFWPPVRARLQSSADGLINSSSNKFDMCSNSSTKRHFSVLFSKTLEITTTLFDLATTSMVTSFQPDVWPVMVKVMHHILTVGCVELKSNKPSEQSIANVSPEYQALLSCLTCINNVFSEKEAGLQLSQLVPTIGAILLPLLSIQNEMIGEMTMTAMKSLLKVENDVLWRSLVVSSGSRFHARPLCPFVEKYDHGDDVVSSFSLSQQRSAHLMKFANSLSEQSIL